MLIRTPVGEPGAGPYADAVDATGVAWITLVHAGQVARVPPGGPPELHDLGDPASRPSLLAPAGDGAVWVTRGGDGRIDRIDGDGTRRSVPVGTGPYTLTSFSTESVQLDARALIRTLVGVLQIRCEDRLLDDADEFVERDLALALHEPQHREVDVHVQPPLFR